MLPPEYRLDRGQTIHDEIRPEYHPGKNLKSDDHSGYTPRDSCCRGIYDVFHRDGSRLISQCFQDADTGTLFIDHARHCRQANQCGNEKKETRKNLCQSVHSLRVIMKKCISLYIVTRQYIIRFRSRLEKLANQVFRNSVLRPFFLPAVRPFLLTRKRKISVRQPALRSKTDLFQPLFDDFVVFRGVAVLVCGTRKCEIQMSVSVRMKCIGSREYVISRLLTAD